MSDTIPALSIRAPWWWWILYGGKDIENRDWPTRYRGPVLIHASKWFQGGEITDDWACARQMWGRNAGVNAPKPTTTLAALRVRGGHIVGRARIVDCVTASPSPWFVGRYGFVLADAEPIPTPIPCKGSLGFFRLPAGVEGL